MASKKFFVDIDLNRNQLLKAVLETTGTTALATILTTAGQIGYDNQTNQINYYDGSNVQYLLAGTTDFSGNTTSDVKAASIKAIYDYYKSSGATGGAAEIGIEDTDDWYTSTDVEGALQEIGAALNTMDNSMQVVGTLIANNSGSTYPTSGGTIRVGDAWLVVAGDTGKTYENIGPNSLWTGVGSLIVSRVSGATNLDSNWFILDARRQPSQETIAGIIAIATQAEVDNGVDDTKAVTPLKLKAFIQNISGTTIYTALNVPFVGSPLSATTTHNLGLNVVIQVWLSDEEITSGVALTKALNTAIVTVNQDPGDVDIVCIGNANFT